MLLLLLLLFFKIIIIIIIIISMKETNSDRDGDSPNSSLSRSRHLIIKRFV